MDKVIPTGDNHIEIVETWENNVDNYPFSVDKPVETNTFRCDYVD